MINDDMLEGFQVARFLIKFIYGILFASIV